MIAVSVMLALFLAWPLVFGHRGATVDAAPAEAHVAATRSVVSLGKPKLLQASMAPLESSDVRKPESCYKRYQREVAACSAGSAACKIGAADHWDLCEATGFWPE